MFRGQQELQESGNMILTVQKIRYRVGNYVGDELWACENVTPTIQMIIN